MDDTYRGIFCGIFFFLFSSFHILFPPRRAAEFTMYSLLWWVDTYEITTSLVFVLLGSYHLWSLRRRYLYVSFCLLLDLSFIAYACIWWTRRTPCGWCNYEDIYNAFGAILGGLWGVVSFTTFP